MGLLRTLFGGDTPDDKRDIIPMDDYSMVREIAARMGPGTPLPHEEISDEIDEAGHARAWLAEHPELEKQLHESTQESTKRKKLLRARDTGLKLFRDDDSSRER